jgi:hypothetical protein
MRQVAMSKSSGSGARSNLQASIIFTDVGAAQFKLVFDGAFLLELGRMSVE